MDKISCAVVRDLLPLYMDGAVSEETSAFIEEHLTSCEACTAEYEKLKQEVSLPEEAQVNEESRRAFQNFSQKIKEKRIRTAVITALCTALVLVGAYCIFTDRSALTEYFTPSIEVSMQNVDAAETWRQVRVGNTGYLNFNSRFYKMKILPGAGADYSIAMRISDLDGNPVLDNITLTPGKSISLDVLKRNTDYKVEIKTSEAFVFFTFV